MTVKQGSEHAAACERTFRTWMTKGLRYVKLPTGGVRIKLEWIDEWLESFEVKHERTKSQVDGIVDEVMAEI